MNGIDHVNNALQALFAGLKVKTSGIWSYVKLPNGLAIAWGTAVDTSTTNTQEATCYYSVLNVDLPRGLFVAYPQVHTSTNSNYMGGAVVSTKDSLRLYNYTIMSIAHTNFRIALFAVGHWK